MKFRIYKLKNRKGKVDLGLKTCRWCSREFHEKENFSWKCRTHRGEYSTEDDMWWCCGKMGKDCPGCKFSKHEEKEDEDDEDQQEAAEENKNMQLKNTRC